MKIKLKKEFPEDILREEFKPGNTYNVRDIDDGSLWTNYSFYIIQTLKNGVIVEDHIGEEYFDHIELLDD